MNGILNEDYHSCLEKEWPNDDAVQSAHRQASLVLGDDERLRDAATAFHTPARVWWVCKRAWPSFHAEGITHGRFATGVDALLHPWMSDISNYAAALIRWNGYGDLPHPSYGDKKLAPTSLSNPVGRKWSQDQLAIFRDALQHLDEPQQPRVVSPFAKRPAEPPRSTELH